MTVLPLCPDCLEVLDGKLTCGECSKAFEYTEGGQLRHRDTTRKSKFEAPPGAIASGQAEPDELKPLAYKWLLETEQKAGGILESFKQQLLLRGRLSAKQQAIVIEKFLAATGKIEPVKRGKVAMPATIASVRQREQGGRLVAAATFKCENGWTLWAKLDEAFIKASCSTTDLDEITTIANELKGTKVFISGMVEPSGTDPLFGFVSRGQMAVRT